MDGRRDRFGLDDCFTVILCYLFIIDLLTVRRNKCQSLLEVYACR